MGTTTALTLSPGEQSHIKVMQAIAHDLLDLPMVLKGGTALLLCYGLDRFSEDLDFDAPKRFNISNRVEKVLSRMASDFEIKTVKDTETVHRLKIHYRTETIDRLLKIETSFRQPPNANDIVEIDGIKTYRIGALISQKMGALVGRTKARDLYDVAFLTRNYRTEFSAEASAKLAELMADMSAMESRFSLAFEDDTILRPKLLPELLLQLVDNL